MKDIQHYYQLFSEFLSQNPLRKEPYNLYEPADYILSIGGKRLRPVFVMIGCGLYKKDVKEALKASMAIEVFHNFTLLHDDIMDEADVRRGQPTVHKKYNTNTAILSGDVMMIIAYQYILDYGDATLVKNLLTIFNKMAFEVCEGQQLDVDFESRNDVTISEYLHMITLKTSVLIASAVQIGALIGGAPAEDQHHLYEFAKNFGIAFQLQDDILDTFGDSADVGKRIGGDILRNKKTYLYLKAHELADKKQQDTLFDLYKDVMTADEDSKINTVISIFKDVNVLEYSRQVIEAYRDLSISHLNACNITENSKTELKSLIDGLIFRKS